MKLQNEIKLINFAKWYKINNELKINFSFLNIKQIKKYGMIYAINRIIYEVYIEKENRDVVT